MSFGSRAALRGVDLTVEEGERVLIAGPSGSGKSTLLRCLTRLIPQCIPARVGGTIAVNGRDIAHATVAELSREVGVVFQNPRTQLLNVRVEDEVAFGPRNLGLSPEAVEDRIVWALETVGLSHVRQRTTHALSGGERQRLAIAAVLAMGPKTLVLDEPLASLDGEGTGALVETVLRLNEQEGVTIVVVEHRLGPAAAMATRTVILDAGQIVADGPTDDVLAEDALLRELGLRVPEDEIQTPWMDLVEPFAQNGRPQLVSLRGVTAGPGRMRILKDVDLTLHEGDYVALVGANGAGKTTLARLIAGLIRSRHGQVSRGRDRPGRRSLTMRDRRLRPGTGVGMLFQDPTAQLLCDTVEEEVALGPRNIRRYSPAAVDEVLDLVDLGAMRTRPVYALSLGEQQRLAVAAVMSMAPRLLILDEPTVGQDWAHMERFMEGVRRLNEQGTAILLITHDHKLVRRWAGRIVVLDHGRIVAQGAVRRTSPRPEVSACA